jgi:ubiquitin carboxyl-terminal hydrolase 25/28
LLQYFYTIKDLREAVLQLSQFDTKVLDDADAKLTEDNLKKIRVGGRNITRREIMRSRKCA